MTRVPRLTAISRLGPRTPEDFGVWLEALAVAGVDAVQIREKHLSDRELLDLTKLAVDRVAGRCRVLVNGRADIALAAGADGVHLASDGVPVDSIRQWLGPHLLIGCSAHSIAEVDRARLGGADYAYFSPVFESPGKVPVGLEVLERAAGRDLPVIALGGITIGRLETVAAAGAAGVAAIRMLADPETLPAVVAAASRALRP